jgi:toxin ParE1/3/4
VAHAEQVRFLDEASAEFLEALRWYGRRDPEIAEAFLRAVQRATATIAEAPERWPVKNGTRRFLLGHFPYTIAYRIDGPLVLLIAVAHQRRDPASWSTRR